MATVKLITKDTKSLFGNQTGSVSYSLEDFHKIYVLNKAIEDFAEWTGREHYVYCQGRTSAYNKEVGGISTSNHLKALAQDTYWKDVKWTDERFIKWAKKWKEICKYYGFVGEIGYYPSYTYKGCVGMIHLGGWIDYSKNFYHWKTTNGKQVNNPFSI